MSAKSWLTVSLSLTLLLLLVTVLFVPQAAWLPIMVMLGLFLLLPVPGLAYYLAGSNYLPEENHVGAIYRRKRFHRFVGPNDEVFISPFWEEAKREFTLDFQMASLKLPRFYLSDQIPADVALKFSFTADIREVDKGYLPNLLRTRSMPDLVTFISEPIAIEELKKISWHQLQSAAGFERAREAISERVIAQLRPMGIKLSEKTGVRLLPVRANPELHRGLERLSAAALLGQAARERNQPIMEPGLTPAQAQALQTASIAAAITQTDQLPAIVNYGVEPVLAPDGRTLQSPNGRPGDHVLVRANGQNRANGRANSNGQANGRS